MLYNEDIICFSKNELNILRKCKNNKIVYNKLFLGSQLICTARNKILII
jgi:hypothetical protein